MATNTITVSKSSAKAAASTDYFFSPTSTLKNFTLINASGNTVGIEGVSSDYIVTARGTTIKLTAIDGSSSLSINAAKAGATNYINFLDGQVEVKYTPKSGKTAASFSFGDTLVKGKLDLSSDKASYTINDAKTYFDVETAAGGSSSPGSTNTGSVTTSGGKSFTLTANADGPGATAPAMDPTGTANNDTYFAADTTLNNADVIDAKGGDDSLAVRAGAAATMVPLLTSIETVTLTDVSANAAVILNLASATGLKTATITDQIATNLTTEFRNIPAGVSVGMSNADGASNFSFDGAAARTGTADEYKITIANGSGTPTTAAVLDIENGAGAADATFENVTITASGAGSVVDLGRGDTTYRVINVSGTATATAAGRAGSVQTYGLTLTDANASATAMRTVNASSLTGGLDIDLSASTQTTVAFTGSGGNDRVVISGTVAAAANTLSLAGGGGSNDILAISTSTDFTAAGQAVLVGTINAATGFESLEGTAGDVTVVNADSFTNINSFIFSGAQTAGHTVSNLRTGDSLAYTVDSTRAGDVITLSGAVAGQTIGLTVTGGVDLTASAAGNALTANSGVTTINLASKNISGAAAATATNTIQAATTVAAIDNVSTTSFVVTGDAGLSIGAIAGLAAPVGFTQAVSVDASALTGILRIAGSTGADAIKGGSAADILYGLDGNDELTGNGGADQFRFLTATEGTDVIKDFTVGTDKIGIVDAVNNFAGATGTAAGAAIAATDYEAGRNAITNIVAGDNLKVIELQTALTTAQLGTQLSAAAAAGIVLVFNSTTGRGEMWYDPTWDDVTADRVQLATFDNITTLAGLTSLSAADFVNFVV